MINEENQNCGYDVRGRQHAFAVSNSESGGDAIPLNVLHNGQAIILLGHLQYNTCTVPTTLSFMLCQRLQTTSYWTSAQAFGDLAHIIAMHYLHRSVYPALVLSTALSDIAGQGVNGCHFSCVARRERFLGLEQQLCPPADHKRCRWTWVCGVEWPKEHKDSAVQSVSRVPHAWP